MIRLTLLCEAHPMSADRYPQDLLFKLPYGREGKTLFTSQADLARAIIELEGSEFRERREESVRSYLSQVFKPASDKQSRPLGPNLEHAILAAVEERLRENFSLGDFAISFREAFRNLKAQVGLPRTLNEVFEELKTEASRAECHVIFTSSPAEAMERSKYADQLRDDMVERLCLNRRDLTHADVNALRVNYEFYVDRTATAHRLWNKLYDHLSDSTDTLIANRNLRLVNEARPRKLSVYRVPSLFCVFPTVVFDPYRATPQGFNLYYHNTGESGGVSVARMSPEAIEAWRREIYDPNSIPSLANNVEEIRFSDCQPDPNFLHSKEVCDDNK